MQRKNRLPKIEKQLAEPGQFYKYQTSQETIAAIPFTSSSSSMAVHSPVVHGWAHSQQPADENLYIFCEAGG